MKLKKIIDVAKRARDVEIYNVSGAVIIRLFGAIFCIQSLPSISSPEEFGTVFEIDRDELCDWNIRIDTDRDLIDSFYDIKRGLPVERFGSLAFGGIKATLFKKAETRQLSLFSEEEDALVSFDGYIAVSPEMLTPISDGIISFEFIRFLGKKCIAAMENGNIVALIEPEEVTHESIDAIKEAARGLSEYYSKEK